MGALVAGLAVPLVGHAAHADGQEATVVVERTGDPMIDIAAGEMVTVPFLVSNRGVAPVTLALETTAPAGWRLIVATERVRLAPGETAVRLVGVAAPPRARPGRHAVSLSVADVVDPSIMGRDTVALRVAARPDLSVRHDEAPVFVVGGEAYTTSFLVTNRGNVALELSLEARSSHGFPFRVATPRIGLAPGESRSVELVIETAEVRRQTRSNVDLLAVSVPDGAVRERGSSSVPVLPRTPRAERQYQWLPTTVTLRGAAFGAGVPPVELAGAGSLSRGGRDRIDFRFRGPGAEQAAFGLRDEYHLSYRSPLFDLQLGDQSYGLSRLTEPGRLGFGGGGTVRLGSFSAGGFHSIDRRTPIEREQTGAFLGLQPLPGLGLGLQGLRRTGFDESEIVSARGELRPFRLLGLNGEVAAGRGLTGQGRAAALDASGRTGRLSYDVRFFDADRTFPGFFRGVTYLTAGATVRPFRWLALDGYYQDQTQELDDGMRTSGLVRGAISLGRFFTVRAHRATLDHPFGLRPVAGEEEQVEAHLALGGRAVRLSLGGGAGRVTDRLEAGAPADAFYDATTRLNLARGPARLGGSLQYRHGGSLYMRGFDERWNARVDGGLRWPSTELQVGLSGTRTEAATRTDFGVLDVRLRQRVLFGHEIELRGYSTVAEPSGFRRTILVADYRVPFGVPVRALPQRGEVRGRLYDAETGAGLTRVPVRLGSQTVVTDRDGMFVVRELEPGTHYLQVESAGGAAGKVPLIMLPAEVAVVGELPGRIEIGFVAPATVEGRIRVFGFDPEAELAAREEELIEVHGLGGVQLELEDGDLVRTVTGSDGRFRFRDLRPGRWTLRVVGGPIPEHHALVRDSVTVDLEPGMIYDADLRVEELRRRLHLLPGAELVVERAAPARPDAPPVGPAAPRPVAARYLVGFEDQGLWDIAGRVYGDPALWPKIWVANRNIIVDPDYIRSGTVLVIPQAAPLTAEERAARDAYARDIGRYEVQIGDRGLFDLARKLYGDEALWPKIWVANRDVLTDPDHVEVGTVLRIPRIAPLTDEERAAREDYYQRRP